METKIALHCFRALSQETRLKIFRLLVHHGQDGIAAGKIAEALQCPVSTLSFHLKSLQEANLIRSGRNGRSLIYTANFAQARALNDYLYEKCCGGAPCATTQILKEPQS